MTDAQLDQLLVAERLRFDELNHRLPVGILAPSRRIIGTPRTTDLQTFVAAAKALPIEQRAEFEKDNYHIWRQYQP